MVSANRVTPAASADLARVDQQAFKHIQAVAPIEVRLAGSEAERRAAFQLRYQAIVERGWMRPEDFPDGADRDHFDDDAVQIIAWDKDVAVGAARVVLPKAGRRLPTEEAFDVTVEPQGNVVDWGRNVVSRAYTGPAHLLFAALLAQSWLETRAHGYSQVCGNASAAVIRIYRMAANVTVYTIGPQRVHCGEKRYPIRFDFRMSLDRL